MKNDYLIRNIEAKDLEVFVNLCEAHAHYEQCEYDKKGKVILLEKSFFKKPVELYGLVVEFEEQLIGFASYMKQYATWDARSYIYMDCLFIDKHHRSKGLGDELIKKIKQSAILLECNHIQWQTPEFNTRAIKFYKRIGATSKSKERFFLEV